MRLRLSTEILDQDLGGDMKVVQNGPQNCRHMSTEKWKIPPHSRGLRKRKKSTKDRTGQREDEDRGEKGLSYWAEHD